MANHIEITFSVEFDSTASGDSYNYHRDRILAVIREELAHQFRNNRISAPKITSPFDLDYRRELEANGS